jgi:hypothetical protein
MGNKSTTPMTRLAVCRSIIVSNEGSLSGHKFVAANLFHLRNISRLRCTGEQMPHYDEAVA